MNYHYAKWLKKIRSMAWDFHRKTGLPIDELIAEGNLAYTCCAKHYNPHKGDFRPYLCSAVYNSMKRYAEEFSPSMGNMHTTTMSNPEVEAEWAAVPDPLEIMTFNDTLQELSKEAQEVVNLIFDMPQELIDMAKKAKNKVTMGVLRGYFRRRDWTYDKIEFAFNEIREVL